MIARNACCLSLALLAMSAPLRAGDLIYANGFEPGAAPTCVAGALAGATLAAPALDGAELLGCFEIRNDGPTRSAALAQGSLPLARSVALQDVHLHRLLVIGPGGRRWPAQFQPLSRWGAPLAIGSAPIRWLQTALSVDIEAGQSATLALLRLPQPLSPLPSIETIIGVDQRRTVDTGWIVAELDGAASQPIRRLSIRSQLGGPLTEIFAASGDHNEGWRVYIADSDTSIGAGESQPGTIVVDRTRWESGEASIQSVLQIDGHFQRPDLPNFARCNEDPTWHRFPWSLRLRLVAGSADLQFDWQLGNACGLPQGPANADSVRVHFAQFGLPLQRAQGGADSIYLLDQGFDATGPILTDQGTELRVRQRRGDGVPWQRRADVIHGSELLQALEYLPQPGLGVHFGPPDAGVVAVIAQPWMRYREPQSLIADGQRVAFGLVSEEIRLGKAKSLWFGGRLALRAGVPRAQRLEEGRTLHPANLAALERPLLLRPLPESLDAAAVLPPLSGNLEAIPTGLPWAYRAYTRRKHDDTVGDEQCVNAGNDQGSQWTCAKTFGLQLWPDVQFNAQFGYVENPDPASNEVKLNYWDPAHIELTEFLRSGDPIWAHDFALPQARLMAHTAYYNFGAYRGSNIGGHSFGSGGSGDGLWHRGAEGSADYSYNRHQALAYLLDPNPAQHDRFAAAGHAAGLRFVNDPSDDTSWSAIGRLNLQYLESLANCAQFVQGTDGLNCDNRLRQVLGRLIDNSLSAGLMCERKFAPGPDCFLGQYFMLQAWYYPILERLYLNYGPSFPLAQSQRWQRALSQTPARVLAQLPRSGGRVDVNAVWPNALQCQLGGADFSQVMGCSVIPDPDNLRQNKPALLSMLVRGHAWDATLGLCQSAREMSTDLFGGSDPLGNLRDVVRGGWWKGAAESGQELVTAALGASQCQP